MANAYLETTGGCGCKELQKQIRKKVRVCKELQN